MDNERETLINRLTKLYPYKREWFESRTTAQLIAMYNQPRHGKNRNAARLVEVEPKDSTYRKYDDETGQWMVRTDGHGWEPEEN